MKPNYQLILLVTCVSVVLSENVRPNIVLVITDDQDLVLGGMEPMNHVQNLIANQGAIFTNSFTASPICCPSRATILTGMYPHNHGTLNNSVSGGCFNERWRQVERNTFAAILSDNGYDTFYAGKYLNEYGMRATGGPSVVPPGWSSWHGLVGNSRYYDYTLSNNGVPSGMDDKYLTDVIADLALDFLSSRHQQADPPPFLMVLAPPAPHAPFTPADRHKGKFGNITAPRTPSFNVKAEDKHWLMRMQPSPLPPDMMETLDWLHRSRHETLLAVDEMVQQVLEYLDDTNQLDDAYVIYTSDNGYHIGQFSQVLDKRQPYETDIRVPLVIRGPGIKKKSMVHNPTINIDLAPTILSLAGIEIPEYMDGVAINFTGSLKAEFQEKNMLIEYYGEGADTTVDAECLWKRDENLCYCGSQYACKCQDSRNNTYACVRHLHTNINFKYCHFDDSEEFEEMYDLSSDPYELHNIVHDVLPAVRVWYQLQLARLRGCVGGVECTI